MTILWNDFRYSIRSLKKSPAFTFLAVLILALGIGATTAIFSVVNAVLIQPLPYQNPSRLVAFTTVSHRANASARVVQTVSLDEVEAWRRHSQAFESIGSFVFSSLPVQVGQQSYFLAAVGADPEFLSTLGVSPAIGRNFPGAGSDHKEMSIIISHRFWQSAFESDTGVLGRTLIVDGDLYTVAGVLPASFQFPRSDASYSSENPDLLFPVANIADVWGRNNAQWFAFGRLHEGTSLAQAQSELQSITGNLVKEIPATSGLVIRLAPLDAETNGHVRPALLLMLGISIVLLLIACTNIMNLLFSRATTRAREMAVRKAVGASTWRLVRQMLTESAAITFLGGIVGVALAWSVLDILVGLSPAHLPISGRVQLDPIVLGFAFAVCAVASLIAGLIPALHSSLQREDLLAGSGTRASGGRLLASAQRALIVTQVALGLSLLTAAGLLSHSLWRLSSVDLGFRSQGVLGFELAIPSAHSGDYAARAVKTHQLYHRMLEATRAIPGVISAGWITNLPPETRAGVFAPCAAAAKSSADKSQPKTFCNTQISSEDYFHTVGVPLLMGRDFTEADTSAAPEVIIVNESLARAAFPNQNPVGQKLVTMFDDDKSPRTIIGVIRDIRDRGLDAKSVLTVYLPYQQFAQAYGSIAVRTALPFSSIVPEIRRRIALIDPSVPLTNFQSIQTRIHKTLDEPRFYTIMAAACAFMATLFVTLGLYGVVAYSVSRRNAEIGIRMALGARRSGILRMVIAQGLKLAALGVVAGIAVSLAASRILSSFLFQIKSTDPAVFAGASVLVIAVTLLATYFPARRASHVDPIIALRHQ